jgi:hypothetical protein
MTTLATRRRGAFDRARVALGGAGAAVLGAAPHVLHHAGPLAGAALLGGAAGIVLFATLGLLVAIPMLRRLRRHTGTWLAPGAALALLAALFAASSFVIGPAVGADDRDRTHTPSAPSPAGHDRHHR